MGRLLLVVLLLAACEPPPEPEPCPDMPEARQGIEDLKRRAREAGVDEALLVEPAEP